MPTFEEHVDAIEAEHTAIMSERDAITAERDVLVTNNAKLEQTIVTLQARIAELEAPPPVPVQPPPQPQPVPPTPPAILSEAFDGSALNMSRFVLDKTPTDAVVVSNGQCLLKWKASSDLTHMRGQIVMRAIPGSTNDTPRRDPIGSERFYAFGIYLPTAYSFSDQWANRKCVSGQFHQGNGGGIKSPPFSFEQIKTSADGEVMRGVLALYGKDTKTIIIGKPPRTETKIVVHVKWSAGADGFLRVYRDGVLTAFNHSGPTCNPRTLNGETVDDLNPMLSNYNPSRKDGDFVVGYERHVVFTYWKIGTEANVLSDFV